MPITLPTLTSRFIHYVGINGTILASEMGPDYPLPDGAIFKQAEFATGPGEEPGAMFLFISRATPDEKEGEPSLRLQVYFARKVFFKNGAPITDSTIEEIQQLSEPFIGKKLSGEVHSRLVATEQDLQQTSLVRPLIGLASRSGSRSLKLAGAEYEISPPQGAQLSWTFKESDRTIVTGVSAPLSVFESNSIRDFVNDIVPAFEIFVIGSK